jgi:hypothetical protein
MREGELNKKAEDPDPKRFQQAEAWHEEDDEQGGFDLTA